MATRTDISHALGDPPPSPRHEVPGKRRIANGLTTTIPGRSAPTPTRRTVTPVVRGTQPGEPQPSAPQDPNAEIRRALKRVNTSGDTLAQHVTAIRDVADGQGLGPLSPLAITFCDAADDAIRLLFLNADSFAGFQSAAARAFDAAEAFGTAADVTPNMADLQRQWRTSIAETTGSIAAEIGAALAKATEDFKERGDYEYVKAMQMPTGPDVDSDILILLAQERLRSEWTARPCRELKSLFQSARDAADVPKIEEMIAALDAHIRSICKTPLSRLAREMMGSTPRGGMPQDGEASQELGAAKWLLLAFEQYRAANLPEWLTTASDAYEQSIRPLFLELCGLSARTMKLQDVLNVGSAGLGFGVDRSWHVRSLPGA